MIQIKQAHDSIYKVGDKFIDLTHISNIESGQDIRNNEWHMILVIELMYSSNVITLMSGTDVKLYKGNSRNPKEKEELDKAAKDFENEVLNPLIKLWSASKNHRIFNTELNLNKPITRIHIIKTRSGQGINLPVKSTGKQIMIDSSMPIVTIGDVVLCRTGWTENMDQFEELDVDIQFLIDHMQLQNGLLERVL